MKLKTNILNHYENSNDYPYYMEMGQEIENPNATIFKGDLMYDKKHKSIGVVLGCVDEKCGELRLDSDGMQPIENLRFARMLDFTFLGVTCKKSIRKEILSEK